MIIKYLEYELTQKMKMKSKKDQRIPNPVPIFAPKPKPPFKIVINASPFADDINETGMVLSRIHLEPIKL